MRQSKRVWPQTSGTTKEQGEESGVTGGVAMRDNFRWR